jgi:hypothetical protein
VEGFLGRGISPSQGRYLHSTTETHSGLEWDSNARYQCLSESQKCATKVICCFVDLPGAGMVTLPTVKFICTHSSTVYISEDAATNLCCNDIVLCV